MMNRRFAIGVAVLCGLFTQAKADICTKWSEPKVVGELNTKMISEASGMAISRKFENRMYHNNDSGDGGFFYVTGLDGSNTQKVTVPRMKPEDVEDMSIGPCGSESCLYLADIGDNDEKRKSIEIWAIKEEKEIARSATIWKTITLTYPDRGHNAEAMAVHPTTGDIYILTKEGKVKKETAHPTQLFRLKAENFRRATRRAELELVGEIDVPYLNRNLEFFGKLVTGMSISADGSKLILITYQNAIEINFGLLSRSIDSRKWKEGEDYSTVLLTYLQQEAIAYANDGMSFYYDSEFNADESDETYIYQVSCL